MSLLKRVDFLFSGQLHSRVLTAKIVVAVCLCVMGIATLVRPDTETLQMERDGAKASYERDLKQVEGMEALARKIGNSKIPLLLVTDAIYLARYIGAAEDAIKVFDDHIDFPVPLAGASLQQGVSEKDTGSSVTGPMLAKRLADAVRVLNKNCSIQKIWPEMIVRVYTKSSN